MAQEIQTNLETVYNKKLKTIDKRILSAIEESKIDFDSLTLEEVRQVATSIIDLETKTLQDDVESLLAQKEAIERQLEKQSESLQNTKYTIFNILEEEVLKSQDALAKLHQVKLQSIDLYDILSEMVESAIITALEKDTDGDITETNAAVIKEISYESIKEGSLNTIRVRKILSTILVTAIGMAEATPNRGEQILSSTLKGMRSGLIKSIDRFKKRLEFMPIEAKHILIEDYDTIIEDLNQTDTLFSQVVITQANESSKAIKDTLVKLNNDMAYDLEELILISKETADIMKSRFSSFAKSAIKYGKDAIDKK